jgi:phytanoyl-CoA hydroxylase
MLSPAALIQFQRDGYLILTNYLSPGEIDTARKQIASIIDEFDPSKVSVFSTTDHSLTSTCYFIDSASRISCFFEEAAFDQQGRLNQAKELSINKIGHALHDLDPVFHDISYKKELAEICRQLNMKEPQIVQSQYIFKQPGIGGKVAPHQDSTFIYTNPPSCLGFWMALEDATLENGCLMAIPGSHQSDLGSLRFVRNAQGTETFFVGEPGPPVDLDLMVPLEVESGSLIILHGALVHMSTPNHSSHSRHAYVLHLVDEQAHWSTDNWLQRPDNLPFRRLNQHI